MKKWKYLMLIVTGIILFSSCGKDGLDGTSYIAINDSQYSDEFCTSYWDDNPSIPYGISWGTYYQSSPGTYDYEYDVSYYNSYTETWWDETVTGTYTLTENKGEKGGLFKNGVDGSDKYYDFYCNCSSAYLSYKSSNLSEPICLPDTVIYYDGYQMVITRKIMPDDYKSINHPKLIKEKGGQ